MSLVISNREFLKQYPEAKDWSFLLPQEVELVQARIDDLERQQNNLIQEKIKVTGGDDWHDGAFRATDSEAIIINNRVSALAGYLRSTIVEYPQQDEDRATLGSRVSVRQGKAEYQVDIVGVSTLHDTNNDDLLSCSVESPLARVIIGQHVGHIASINLAGRNQQIEILAIDQEAQKNEILAPAKEEQ